MNKKASLETEATVTVDKRKRRINLRALTVTAIMSAVGAILMLAEFPLPSLIPAFVKLDFSELPALITTFAFGPGWGVLVCLLKNLLHLMFGSSMGVGELANFVLGAAFVFIAGLIYQKKKNRAGALLGCLAGAAAMGLVSVPLNYFIVYPLYAKVFNMTEDMIVGMYQSILPKADTLLKDLLIFNLPFTVAKGIIDSAMCFLLYKPLSPLLKGRH